MSTFTIETVPHERIIVAAVTDDYSVMRDQCTLFNQLQQVVDAASSGNFLIFDLVHLHISFDELLFGSNDAALGSGAALFHHQNIRETILVSPNKLLHLTARGMKSSVFGSLSITAVDTFEEALAYANQQITA